MRELKIHLLREGASSLALCGKMSQDYTTEDPELISCKTCSGIYRTNTEWYSKVRNRHMVPKSKTGEDDVYTTTDVAAGLMRLGWREEAVFAILLDTKIFRNVPMVMLANGQWKEVADE